MDSELLQRAQSIKLVVFDVDGVLTDGRLYLLPDGTECKVFNTLDGQGIKLLKSTGIDVAIISGRSSAALTQRASTLGVRWIFQGREDKLQALEELRAEHPFAYTEIAYLGDDLPDLPAIRRVGLGMAVANAHPFVRMHAHGSTQARGGEGAAREFCDLIMQAQGTLTTVQMQYL